MKLGDVLKKERQRIVLSAQGMADSLGLDAEAYASLEAGESEAETWGPVLARLAIHLETPTSRLLSSSGRSQDIEKGGPGSLISERRQALGQSRKDMGSALGMSEEQVAAIEAGETPLETVGRQLLAFAEAIEQPIFNLFYPCGLPFQELDDYP
jgi:transcriptional regulator with XRE-family HTH domain